MKFYFLYMYYLTFDENQFGGVDTEAKTWYDLHSRMTLTSRSCILKVTESVAVI